MSSTESKVAKNWSLIIGLAIPVLMVVFIGMSIYLPRIFDNTPPASVNFLYSSKYYNQHHLVVNNNKLEWTLKEGFRGNKSDNDQPPKIYLHNVKSNKSQELTLTEAQNLILDSRNIAPDGYSIERNRHRGFFLFDGNYSRNHHLVNGHTTQKLNLEYLNNYYYNFDFLGWVIE